MEFEEFPKIPRFSRQIIVTEKLDGTNAQIYIDEAGNFLVGSRSRWITPEQDNYGFARWAHENKEELMKLGPGRHFGEWWGSGIQRRYNEKEKVFSLFNADRWSDAAVRPACCSVVPTLYKGPFDIPAIDACLEKLKTEGSVASPGFMKAEGIIIYHYAARMSFKKTIEKDEMPKGMVENELSR